MHLRNVRPDAARRQEADPGFCEFAVRDPVHLHPGLGLCLTGLGIRPLECKTKPSAIA
jgi:hypothetical protein